MVNHAIKKEISVPDGGFYQLVLDSIEDYAVFTLDKKGIVNSWNNGAANLLGYTEEEIIGINGAIFFTQQDLKKAADKKELVNALKFGSTIDERFHVRKDGSEFWASGKMFPLFDTANKHIGFTKVMRNLDARKLLQEQSLEAKRYADSIVEFSREPIVVLNDDLTINTANRSFYELFKIKSTRPLKGSIFKIRNRLFNIPQLTDLLKKVQYQDHGIKNFELVYDWPLLGKKFFLINAKNITHQSSKSHLIFFSIQDISEQRTLEQQKDDFISIASHEIRTPITVIKAYAQLLYKRSSVVKDDLIANSASKINEKTEKLMSLVSYLLDVSQLEKSEIMIKKEFFNLYDLVKESIEELLLIDPHPFILTGKIDEPVFADRFRISQILNNLLNNASKYSPNDSKIHIKIAKNKAGDKVTVSVKDNGLGIPKEEQSNIFKRFWRASTAKAHNISGIGLGLHISKEIMNKHNGKIWLKSETNKGSTFYFSLPIKNTEA